MELEEQIRKLEIAHKNLLEISKTAKSQVLSSYLEEGLLADDFGPEEWLGHLEIFSECLRQEFRKIKQDGDFDIQDALKKVVDEIEDTGRMWSNLSAKMISSSVDDR